VDKEEQDRVEWRDWKYMIAFAKGVHCSLLWLLASQVGGCGDIIADHVRRS
jgi:hypothetical protein